MCVYILHIIHKKITIFVNVTHKKYIFESNFFKKIVI